MDDAIKKEIYGILEKDPDAFNNLSDNYFKIHCLKISKLLCEAWLGTKEGREFTKDITKIPGEKDAIDLKEALHNRGIAVYSDYVDYELNTSTYDGWLTPKEKLNEGLNLTWYLPYAPRPAKDILDDAMIEHWIKVVDDWMKDIAEDWTQYKQLPTPPSPYIPLATT